jgi:predicted ester cyclase
MGSTDTQTAREVVAEYFDALAARDPDRAVESWRPGAVDELFGFGEMIAPDGIRDYFAGLFAAIPDWRFEVLDTVAEGDQVAVHWRATGTFTGEGRLEGFVANGRSVDMRGLDILTVEDGKIVKNFAYTNAMELARQIGAMPPSGSAQEKAMASIFNAKTALTKRLRR